MKIKSKFNAEIKEREWLYIIAAAVIIVLLIRGDTTAAVKAIADWLKALK